MPKKRKSGGRTKGRKGRGSMIQCGTCGQMVPRDKAKKITRYTSLVDGALARELRQKGAYITRPRSEKYYCVSCAVHRGILKVRAKDKRNVRRRLR